jgi:TonB family protein
MNTLMYQSNHNRRFAAALGAAAIIHVAAIGFATTKQEAPIASGFTGEPTVLEFAPPDPIPDPQPEQSDPIPTPPPIEPLFVEQTSNPPPVRKQMRQLTPIQKARASTVPGAMNLSSAKVFAVSAPRPEYPYEARRQKITGEGIAILNVDPVSGGVTGVTMAKTTGSAFLDNAAIAGFKRWRFKPGTVSNVTCPVTFTLTGASY